MWPILVASLRTYAPYITLPFAGLVGLIGYNLENWMSDKYTPFNKPIKEQRQERLLEDDGKSRKKTSVLDTNLSPSLS